MLKSYFVRISRWCCNAFIGMILNALTAVAEEQDSYDGSSCGSGQSAGSQEDDRSDVASWVALDLRHLRHQHPQDNGYDVMTIDSDFYGYATSGRSSGVPEAGGSHSGTGERPLSWAGTHPTDAESQHSPDVRVRHRERHSATPSTPSHYTNTSTKQWDLPSDN